MKLPGPVSGGRKGWPFAAAALWGALHAGMAGLRLPGYMAAFEREGDA